MDQQESIQPDTSSLTSCFYQIEFNGDVYGLKNRFVMLFGTLSSAKYVLEWKSVATDLF